MIVLVQMTDQEGEVLPLLQEVELDKPKSLTGVINTDAMNALFSRKNSILIWLI